MMMRKIPFPARNQSPVVHPIKCMDWAILLNNVSYNSHRITLNLHSGCTQLNTSARLPTNIAEVSHAFLWSLQAHTKTVKL
jgi:hypothetical protein